MKARFSLEENLEKNLKSLIYRSTVFLLENASKFTTLKCEFAGGWQQIVNALTREETPLCVRRKVSAGEFFNLRLFCSIKRSQSLPKSIQSLRSLLRSRSFPYYVAAYIPNNFGDEWDDWSSLYHHNYAPAIEIDLVLEGRIFFCCFTSYQKLLNITKVSDVVKRSFWRFSFPPRALPSAIRPDIPFPVDPIIVDTENLEFPNYSPKQKAKISIWSDARRKRFMEHAKLRVRGMSVPESAESNKSLSPITPGIWKTFSVERQTRAGARSMRSINALRNMNLCSWWCRKTRQSDGRRGFIGLKYPIFLFSLVFVYDLRRWEMERFRAICFVRWDYRCERDGVDDVSRREAWKWVR